MRDLGPIYLHCAVCGARGPDLTTREWREVRSEWQRKGWRGVGGQVACSEPCAVRLRVIRAKEGR